MGKSDAQIIEARPEMLSGIMASDRDDWTYDMYISAGMEAVNIRGYSGWIIGLLASEVEPKYGSVKDFSNEIHASYGMVRVYKHVYERYTREDKNFAPDGFFPFEVLKIVASTENPIETLDDLRDKGITSVEGAYREIKTQKTGIVVPKKPVIGLYWDEESKKWKLRLNPDDIPEIDWSDVSEQLVDYLTK